MPTKQVDADVIGRHRTSGTILIHPDKNTRNRMVRDGVTSVTCTIKLTISASGSVADATISKTSGYDDYDQKLRAAALAWTYRPYVIDGTPMSVSSTVEFRYSLAIPVDSNVITSYRISGESLIEPDEKTKNQMLSDNVTSVTCIVKLTISASGSVVDATISKTSRYDDYDRKLRAAVLAWTYRPYMPDGTPIPVSSTVRFVYTLNQ